MYYVYIIKSLLDKKFYIGHTSDLRNRFKEHNAGRVVATKYRRPFVLIYYEAYKSIKDATDRERSFKKSGSVYNGLIKRIKRSIDDKMGD